MGGSSEVHAIKACLGSTAPQHGDRVTVIEWSPNPDFGTLGPPKEVSSAVKLL